MAVSIDGENLVITLESGVTNVSWEDVYSDWKNWMLSSPLNRRYPPAFRTSGGEPLNELLDQGAYWFVMNDLGWRIKPPEENITIYASGNLAPNDASYAVFIPTTGAYTAAILGLQPLTQGINDTLTKGLTHGLFGGGVTYDADAGYPGTGTAPNGHLIGTPGAPSSDQFDSWTIAMREGLMTGYVTSNLSIDPSLDVSHFTMYGRSKSHTTITIPDGATAEDMSFFDCKVTGFLDGGSKLYQCLVENLNYIEGYVEECVLSGVGTIKLVGGSVSYFLGCFGGQSQPATIDLGGSGQTLIMEEMYGETKLINKSGSEDVYLILSGGSVRVDLTTVTAGTIHIAGTGRLIDDSNGSLLSSGTYNGLTVLNYTDSADRDDLRKKINTAIALSA